MRKINLVLVFVFAVTSLFLNAERCPLSAEEVQITTYYPAPMGVYKQLQAEKYYGYPLTPVPGVSVTYPPVYYGLDPLYNSYLVNLNTTGWVGVGTPEAVGLLDVSHDAGTTHDLFVNATTGNVGIGESLPKNKLDVEGAVAVGSGFSGVVTGPNNGLIVSGSVGIGTYAPAARLTVETPLVYSGDVIRFQSDYEPGNYWLNLNAISTPAVVKWVFDQRNYGTDYPAVLAFDSGKVGIGTPDPNAALEVNGAISRQGTTLYGNQANTHVNLGVNSITGMSGENLGYCTIGGGLNNVASGSAAGNTGYATVGGGNGNQATNHGATVSGGVGNHATGIDSMILGGYNNTASGDYSFAAGTRAKANHNGCFVWADNQSVDYASTGANQFRVRASGGIYVSGLGSSTGLLSYNATTGQITVATSSARYKKDINTLKDDFYKILNLTPKSFVYKKAEKKILAILPKI